MPAELDWTGKNDDEPKGHAPGQGLWSPVGLLTSVMHPFGWLLEFGRCRRYDAGRAG